MIMIRLDCTIYPWMDYINFRPRDDAWTIPDFDGG